VIKETCTMEDLVELFGLSERQVRRLDQKGVVQRAFPGGYLDEVKRVAKELSEEIIYLASLDDSPIKGKRTKTTIHATGADLLQIIKDIIKHSLNDRKMFGK
jgi:hypothetical protein